MRMRSFVAGGVAAAIALGSGAHAKDRNEQAPPPAVFQKVIDCRTVGDSGARLACFDSAVGALAKASDSAELFVADRERVRETKRGLFGLNLPGITLFGDGDNVDAIDSRIAGLGSAGSGKWVFILDDGARWAQTDTRMIYPKVGDPIHIQKAAMGSFLAKVNGKSPVRVVRRTD